MAFNENYVNPYDPTSPDLTPETIPQDEIIRRAIQAALLSVRVHMPAKITAIKGNQKVDVQLLLQARYFGVPTPVSIPPIQNVMVGMPMGADWSIKCPIKVGDNGYVLFCDRSLDVWSASDGGIVDPQDSRAHDISDPIFVPGLPTFSQQTTDATDDMVLTNGKAVFRIQKAGTFQIKNDSQELLNNLKTLVQTLSTASTVAGGPFTPDVVTSLNQVMANIETLLGT